MSEKSAQTKKKLSQNADKITIAVLILILAGLGYAWWQEQNNTLGSESGLGKPANLKDQLADSPALEMLQGMQAQPTIQNDPGAQRVAQYNMFDFSTMQAEATFETQMQAQVEQAKTMIEQGQIEQARPILEKAKNTLSYNPEVLQLLDKITTAGETGPAPTPPM